MIEMRATRDEPERKPPPVGLEEALDLTGYGRFNYKLLLGLWFFMAIQNFATTDVAYAMPAAECDLQLTPIEKGWINAATYGGMMLTAFVWGALSDVLGRKWLLVTAFLAQALCSAAMAMVTASWMLLVCRVILGMVMIGPASLTLTYAGELFGRRYRSRMFMWAGTMQGMAASSHAALAMWIIPLQLEWLRSWRVFLLVTSLVAACCGIIMLFLPESPKYLAGRGRIKESVAVLGAIYASNTGQPADTYPVKSLVLAAHMQPEPGNPFAIMWRQFCKLVRKPYRTPLLYVLAMQPLILFCLNTLRMWVPQIFAQMERDALAGVSENRDVCDLLEDSTRPANLTASASASPDCENFYIDASVYLNSIIIMSCRAAIQLLASLAIRTVGPKILLVGALSAAAGVLFAWPFAASAVAVLGLSCVFEGMSHTAFSTLMNITVELFPTGVRTSAVSLSNFLGRAGSMVGNAVFPLLFTYHCASAFWIAGALLVLAVVIGLFKPRPSFTPTSTKGVENAAFESSAVAT